MPFTRTPKGRTGARPTSTRTPAPSSKMRTMGKKKTTGTKLTGRANALSRVKNPKARAAISKSKGTTFPAGSLMAQAKANVNSMLKRGGGTTTKMKATMPAKPVKAQRKPKR